MSQQDNGFFILGVQRSGTTLLRLLLDSHSSIAVPFESYVLLEFASKISSDYKDLQDISDRRRIITDLISSKGIKKWNPPIQLEDFDLETCLDYRSVVTKAFSVFARKSGKAIWGDKTPGTHLKEAAKLYKLFPDSKYVHIIRDGRDVASSIARQPWGANTYLSALEYWRDLIEISRGQLSCIPQNQLLEIKYEDLVQDPEKIIKDVLEFIGVDYEPSMLSNYYMNLDKKLPLSSFSYHTNLSRSIDSHLAFKWLRTLDPVDQALSYEIAGNLFDELGYPCGVKNASAARLLMRRYKYRIMEALIWRWKAVKSNVSRLLQFR